MRGRKVLGPALWALGLFLAGIPLRGMACATCFGQSDSALAQGMNWGIFALLVVVVGVLGGVVSFFVFLARRAGSAGAADSPPETRSSPSA